METYLSGFPLPTEWQERGSIAVILVVGGLFSLFNAGIGAVVMAVLAGLGWYAGTLPAEIGAGVILGSLVIGLLWIAFKGT